MGTKRHTTLNLDIELVEEARKVLGTPGATGTIHRALREVVDRDKRLRLLDMGIGDLTPDRLEELRNGRPASDSDSPPSDLH